MAVTNYLGIDKLATGQADKEPTLSAGFDAFDSAIAGINSKNLGGATTTQTLTTAEARRIRHVFTNAGAAISIKYPLAYSNTFFVVYNNSGFALTIITDAGGSTGVLVANGATQVLLINGNNVQAAGPSLSSINNLWTAWTPTWTNLTVGNATQDSAFIRLNKLVHCRLSIKLGSTSSISGDVQFTLPVTRVSYATTTNNVFPTGVASLFDASAGDTFHGTIVHPDTAKGALRALDASATYLKRAVLSSTVPFTWATDDEISAEFFYEAV